MSQLSPQRLPMMNTARIRRKARLLIVVATFLCHSTGKMSIVLAVIASVIAASPLRNSKPLISDCTRQADTVVKGQPFCRKINGEWRELMPLTDLPGSGAPSKCQQLCSNIKELSL